MFSFNPKLNCIQNAFVNMQRAEKNGLDARIWFIGEEVKHAYLQVGEQVLNSNVTWGSNIYPDFTLQELETMQKEGKAHDITEEARRAYKEDDILIINGESAGSMILCDDLEWVYTVKKGTKPKYDIQLATYKGLGVTTYKIFPHWNKVSDVVKERVLQYEKKNVVEITRLNDGQILKIKYPVD